MIDKILEYFGQIKFAEEKSMSAIDFERSFTKFFSVQKRPLEKSDLGKYGKIKFGENHSNALDEFSTSLKEYFY